MIFRRLFPFWRARSRAGALWRSIRRRALCSATARPSRTATTVGATTVSAFQLGISLVPALAGAALNAGAGLVSVAWIGAVLAAAVVPAVLLDRNLSRRRPQVAVKAADAPA
ncbi:hypothetical protein ACQEU3_42060 [Spirillospora sp. CA-253888]